MRMFRPSHPGTILKNYVGGHSVTEVAQHLGVTRTALSRVLNGSAGISAEMALRIGKLFSTDPEFWLRLQAQYDLWRAGQKPPKVIMFRSVNLRTGSQKSQAKRVAEEELAEA